jgi:hypothetical protein
MSTDLDDRRPVMNEILYQDDELWHIEGWRVYDPRALAWLEVGTQDRQGIARALSGKPPDPSESVSVDAYGPQRVELTARLLSPGLVVLSDAFYPGWDLSIDGKPSEILRTNRAMRGALVPSGCHRLVYRYRPRSLLFGAALSSLGLVGCGLLIFRREGRRTPRDHGSWTAPDSRGKEA